MKKNRFVFCDYIALLIHENLLSIDKEQNLDSISKVQKDFAFYEFETLRTIDVEDKNGKQYRITIQEL